VPQNLHQLWEYSAKLNWSMGVRLKWAYWCLKEAKMDSVTSFISFLLLDLVLLGFSRSSYFFSFICFRYLYFYAAAYSCYFSYFYYLYLDLSFDFLLFRLALLSSKEFLAS
jgi:hypothetical protein